MTGQITLVCIGKLSQGHSPFLYRGYSGITNHVLLLYLHNHTNHLYYYLQGLNTTIDVKKLYINYRCCDTLCKLITGIDQLKLLWLQL